MKQSSKHGVVSRAIEFFEIHEDFNKKIRRARDSNDDKKMEQLLTGM